VHPEHFEKQLNFHRKRNEFNEKQVFAKIRTFTSKPLLAAFKVAYRKLPV
jgi:hypothetical protein